VSSIRATNNVLVFIMAGLGLTISRKLVRLMGGELHVESSGMGKGSAFYFTLPYVKGQVTTAESLCGSTQCPGMDLHCNTNCAPRRPSSATSSCISKINLDPTGIASRTTHTGGKILVAEDDPVSRRLVNRMLERAGYSVLLAEDGQQAVSVFAANRDIVSLLLLDVQMPNMDGIEATQCIRRLEKAVAKDRSCNSKYKQQPVPIIALSAGAMKGDHEKGLSVGMTDYLTKPVNYKVLLETLVRYIGAGNSAGPSLLA